VIWTASASSLGLGDLEDRLCWSGVLSRLFIVSIMQFVAHWKSRQTVLDSSPRDGWAGVSPTGTLALAEDAMLFTVKLRICLDIFEPTM
jgi:hypothetical protein